MPTSDHDSQPIPLVLTDDEVGLLHRVACRLVETEARGGPTTVDQYALGRLADWPLVGVFVTLRKDGKLRACIGNFVEATPLDRALERAAIGVVAHDPRFPPVVPEELAQLSLTVSLLHTRELLTGDGPSRADRVEIGQHGLDIQFAGRKGLLLPSVATDFDLDATGFLQAVCRKAGLDEDTWLDPAATLYRFSSISFGGPWTAEA